MCDSCVWLCEDCYWPTYETFTVPVFPSRTCVDCGRAAVHLCTRPKLTPAQLAQYRDRWERLCWKELEERLAQEAQLTSRA